jgi:sugar/nucleoside kinase (ribokinase family)
VDTSLAEKSALSDENCWQTMILVLGYANVDLIASVPQLPTSGKRVTATAIDMFPGGMGANCACAASHLGSEVCFFGSVGNDVYGNFLLNDFKNYSVKTEYTLITQKTTKALISVTPNGERSIISEPFEYKPEALRRFLETSSRSGLFYLDGYHLGVAAKELELAKAKGFTVYCDLDGALDTYEESEILEYLKRVQIVQVTPNIVQHLFGYNKTTTLLNYTSMIIQTNGAEDVELYTPESKKCFAVPKINVVDTTGAGDVFAGSFLHFYERSGKLEASIERAIERAAKSVRRVGARLF